MELLVTAFDGETTCFYNLVLKDIDSLTFSTPEKTYTNFLFHSCRLYVHSCEELLFINNGQYQTVVYNPATTLLKFLPETTIHPVPKPGLDCSRISHVTGFGKDTQTGDFKAIRYVNIHNYSYHDDEDDEEHHYEVYSLQNNSWKGIEASDNVELWQKGSVLVGGTYYWVPYTFGTEICVRGFDFAKEEFVSLCRLPSSRYCSHFLVKLRDETLGCIVHELMQCEGRVREFKLWSWRRVEWVLLEQFQLADVDRPVGFVEGRLLFLEESLSRNRYNSDHRLKVYDIFSRRLRELDVFSRSGNMQVVSYVATSNELWGASPLSNCNNKSVWGDHWQRIRDQEWEELDLRGRARERRMYGVSDSDGYDDDVDDDEDDRDDEGWEERWGQRLRRRQGRGRRCIPP